MANTVYTESVVTLNGAQAEATLNALKSSADELRKKMIEATKLGNTADAAKYQKELDNVNKSMKGIRKETKDYSDIMKKLNGSTLSELQKAYSGLNKQIKNLIPGTKEFIEKSKQLKQVKTRMDEINGSVRGANKTLSALKGMLPKLGIAAVFAAAAKAVVKFGKDAIAQTQAIGDRWQQFTSGARAAYNSFVADLTTGKGWKELISNMAEAYNVGVEVARILDELAERNWSLSRTESKLNIEIEKNKQLMRDTSLTNEERIDAAERVIDAERQLAEERKSIADQEAKAYKMQLQQRLHLDDSQLESYIEEYNQNIELIHQAQEYNAELKKREAAVKSAQSSALFAADANAAASAGSALQKARSELESFVAGTDENVKKWAETDAAYQRSNDELVDNYINALNKKDRADAEFYSSTTRSNTMLASLRKEMSREGLEAMEAGFQAEMDAVARHEAERTVALKEAYASGEIGEEQYQARLAVIQDEAVRGRMAVAERYKKSTIEYQAQLLDATLRQKEELMKIFEDSESSAGQVLAELFEESESEISDIMESVDADLEAQVGHLVELAGQADDIRAMLDPKTALGQQLQSELDNLDEIHAQKLLSEEEYEQAKRNLIQAYARENLNIDLERWMKSAQAAQEYFGAAGDMVSALQDAESARLDAQMEAELAAAGDNAEERERIEAEYEKKKLDTQKKYAVADMVVNIAKTVAAGALAIMQCFSQLGPVAGGVMAAMIGTTTAAQVATIVAQKNQIMNASPSSASGYGASASTSARVATGFSSGGYTGAAANDYMEAGVVHANEWVAPAAMVRANPVVFRRLEQARVRGGRVSGVGGFADGGMTSSAAPVIDEHVIDDSAVRRLNAILDEIMANGIPAYVVLSDLNKKQELSETFKAISSRR